MIRTFFANLEFFFKKPISYFPKAQFNVNIKGCVIFTRKFSEAKF